MAGLTLESEITCSRTKRFPRRDTCKMGCTYSRLGMAGAYGGVSSTDRYLQSVMTGRLAVYKEHRSGAWLLLLYLLFSSAFSPPFELSKCFHNPVPLSVREEEVLVRWAVSFSRLKIARCIWPLSLYHTLAYCAVVTIGRLSYKPPKLYSSRTSIYT
jgi:hypothetical protein